jgi:hypothetical protein
MDLHDKTLPKTDLTDIVAAHSQDNYRTLKKNLQHDML